MNLVNTANNSDIFFPTFCGIFFPMFEENFFKILFLCGSVSRVVGGDPAPYFAVGWGIIARQRLSGLYPVRNFFLNYSLNFFS